MRRTLLIGATLVALQPRASAQAPSMSPADTFEANFAAFAENIRRHFTQQRIDEIGAETTTAIQAQQNGDITSRLDAVHATPELAPLATANATTTAEKLSAAISTGLDGVAAGISLAPAKLAGDLYSPWAGFTLTAASLDDDGFRGGVGWVYEQRAPQFTPKQLKLTCSEKTILEEAYALKSAYVALCAKLPLGTRPSDAGPEQDRWLGIARACGHIPDPIRDRAAGIVGDPLYVRVRDLLDASRSNAAPDRDRTTLEEWQVKKPSFTSCITKEMVAAAYAAALWTEPRHEIGISVHGDFFPIRFGFQPDPDEPLTDGELQQVEGRVEYQFAQRRLTFTIGVGAGYAREAASDDFAMTLSPSVGVRWLVTSLDDRALDRVHVDPSTPVLALGLSARGERTFDAPDSQDTSWNEVELSAYLELSISKDLAFRLGVPLRAEIAVREADPDATPAIEEKRALQWSVPVFFATVLKL